MKSTRNALANRLLSMPAITDLLATFEGVPAIFTTEPVPSSATSTFIIIRDSQYDIPFESKWSAGANSHPEDYVPTRGREVSHDVAIYEEQSGDSSCLEDLALAVRDAFHRYPLTVSGYGTLIAEATGPIRAPEGEEDEDYVEGRIVTVTLTVIRNP